MFIEDPPSKIHHEVAHKLEVVCRPPLPHLQFPLAANARRLQAIAWALLGLQLLSLAIGTIADAVSTPAHPVHVDAGFSISGWLAVLLTFLLARVFAEGTLMRDDLEGTV